MTCLRNGRFHWENIEISQNAMALIANVPNSERNNRNFPFSNTTNHKLLHQTGPKGEILPLAYMNYVTKNRFD